MPKPMTEFAAEVAEPIVADLGLELVDVEYKQEGKHWFLRLFIDSETGVDLDDCQRVSERVSEKLDADDPVNEAYYLEVSSPGAERPLYNEKDITRAIGRNVHLTTHQPVHGENVIEGELSAFDGETLTVQMKQKHKVVPFEVEYQNIAHIRLAVLF
ncbi:ribosome maturation factor RimP [Salsuginibacillus halophilus]|uniref:Ribosome maturation factor RimP n=1 Tax=Salsuginibacillus halophilus TaxID=517424 RepID=A0A2P8HYE1_9BACI|nr:ribosome maturation factor RimP [Salsuginibacillus halophilus]PSL51227.1 ribosome maturation factor RimP [Salsuginibacillus halophilus]